jgi:hypothetical protein
LPRLAARNHPSLAMLLRPLALSWNDHWKVESLAA